MLLKSSNLLFAIIYAYTLYYDYNLTETHKFFPVPGIYLSKLVWLTMINLYLHFLYNSIAALFAWLEIRNPSLLAPFHFVATAIVFPVGFTVVCLFWGLVLMDPAHLMDENAKILLAIKWFNHSLHTLPLVAMILDFCLWRHTRPAKKGAFMTIFVFVCLYMIDIHYFYYVHGVWAYPILGNLATIGRLLFILFCSMFIFAAFLIGDFFNKFVHFAWRRQKRERRRNQKTAVKGD